MIFNWDKERYYYKGIDALNLFLYKKAIKYFKKALKSKKGVEARNYLLYTYLISANYYELSKWISRSQNQKYSGFSLYTLYWYKIMAGEIGGVNRVLYQMLEENNYFLRIFALKELYRKKKITDLKAAIQKYICARGLTYGMHWEEKRAAYLLELLQSDTQSAERHCKQMQNNHPELGDLYLDYLDIAVMSGNDTLLNTTLSNEDYVRMAKKDPRIYYALALEYYKLYVFDKAIANLKPLTRRFITNPFFYFNMGNCYFSKNDWVNSIACYERAVSIFPAYERAYYNAGTAYLKLGEINDAVKNFERAIKINPQPDSLFNLSIALIEKRELTDAYYYLEKIPDYYADRYHPALIQKKIKNLIFQSS